jgi:hypothetical protein
MEIRERDLGPRKFIAEGGFAKVYTVDYTLPSDPTPLAYKEFTVDHAEQARTAEKSVAFRDGLGAIDQADLDQFAVWPRALVTGAKGTVCGLLMPVIPDDFFCHVAGLSGRERKPREMQWLASSADQRAAAQVDFADILRTDRLVLLAQLTYIIGWLHKHGWVFGDLSFTNAVFALDPPRTLLLDCDGAAALSDRQRKQSSTPLWDPPECPILEPPGGRRQQLQDDVTDVYKLGLAILRCLTPGKGAASSRNASRLNGELDPAGERLLARALTADRQARPGASELYRYMRQLAAGRVVIPDVRAVQLVNPRCARGQDARIDWRIDHAHQINVSYGAGRRAKLDAAAHPDGWSFRPDESGPVSMEAVNRFGSVRVDLGDLDLFELPPFSVKLGPLPAVHLPAIEAFPASGLSSMVPSWPSFPEVAAVGMPVLNVADMVPMPAVPPLPPIGNAIQGAAETVNSVILDNQDSFSALLRQSMPGAGTASR